MPIELKINKNEIIKNFLIPVSKISERGTLSFSPSAMESCNYTASDQIQSAVMYIKHAIPNTVIEKINIPSYSRLINLLSVLDYEDITLNIETNHIALDTPQIKFKYHLLSDDVMEKNIINTDKLNQLTFDFNISVSSSFLHDIIKNYSTFLNSITTDKKSNKCYFFTKDNVLFCEFTDRSICNLDNVTVALGNTSEQLIDPFIINIDFFRKMTFDNFETVTFKINTKQGVAMFELDNGKTNIKYVISSQIQ